MIKLKKEGENLMGYNEDNVACCYYPINSEAKGLDLLLLPNPFEEDFWETVPVKWVKWNKKKPHWNGAVWLQFNGKNQGRGTVHNGKLISLEGDKVSEEFIRDYQDTFYWLLQETNKAAQSKQFSLEDMKKHIQDFLDFCSQNYSYDSTFGWYENGNPGHRPNTSTLIENYIQTLSTQQLPVGFIPEPNDIGFMKNADIMVGKKLYDKIMSPFKTIINSEGKQEIQGKYIW